MQRMRFKVGLLLCTLLSVTTAVASSDAAERGKQLIQQAVDKTNIFELPSFRMNANVRIDNMGKPLDGTYSLLWNGPDQWREEITFAGYTEVQVGGKGVVYLKRSTDHLPYQIFQLRETLGFGAAGMDKGFFHLGPRGGEVVKKIHEQKIGGAKATCVEIMTEMKYTREVCVDQASGTVKRDKDSLLDSDLRPIGEKFFPHSLALDEKGKTVVELHITELDASPSFSTSAFQPPTGNLPKAGCMNPAPATKAKVVEPRYPEQDKRQLNQGTVGIYALIDSAGVPQTLEIAFSVTPTLDAASVEALRQWRFQPATCDGSPVDNETIIEIHYTLSGG
jgi:TonB family protein